MKIYQTFNGVFHLTGSDVGVMQVSEVLVIESAKHQGRFQNMSVFNLCMVMHTETLGTTTLVLIESKS